MSLVTYEGKVFDYINPQADTINVKDIVRSISRMSRFVGHSSRAYTVGEHTFYCLVMAEKLGYTPREQLLVLIHDFTEAYVGDMPSPLKRLLPEYSAIEEKVEFAICEHLGIKPPTPEEFLKVKLVDMTMLTIEMKQLTLHDWKRFSEMGTSLEMIDDDEFDLSDPFEEVVMNELILESLERLLQENKAMV